MTWMTSAKSTCHIIPGSSEKRLTGKGGRLNTSQAEPVAANSWAVGQYPSISCEHFIPNFVFSVSTVRPCLKYILWSKKLQAAHVGLTPDLFKCCLHERIVSGFPCAQIDNASECVSFSSLLPQSRCEFRPCRDGICKE